MKKNIIIICLLVLSIFILIGYGFYNKRVIINNVDAILLKDTDTKLPDYLTVFDDYYEFRRYFNDDSLTKDDFNSNNYAIIKIEYDPCADKDIKLIDYTIDKGVIDVLVEYRSICGACPLKYKNYLVKIDKNTTNVKVNINYNKISDEQCNMYETKKPMIYIYPKEDMNISIKLSNPELLTTTYPKYNNGWNIYAKTNGDLIVGNKTYYGLYWEGINDVDNSFEDGFIVNKNDLINFLEDKLSILGLNEREANEFIVYWLPILEENEYNLIRFENIEEINKQMNLDIEPKPDTLIRILMEYKSVNKDYKIKEQILIPVTRNGYTVVEWGGTKIKS